MVRNGMRCKYASLLGGNNECIDSGSLVEQGEATDLIGTVIQNPLVTGTDRLKNALHFLQNEHYFCKNILSKWVKQQIHEQVHIYEDTSKYTMRLQSNWPRRLQLRALRWTYVPATARHVVPPYYRQLCFFFRLVYYRQYHSMKNPTISDDYHVTVNRSYKVGVRYGRTRAIVYSKLASCLVVK